MRIILYHSDIILFGHSTMDHMMSEGRMKGGHWNIWNGVDHMASEYPQEFCCFKPANDGEIFPANPGLRRTLSADASLVCCGTFKQMSAKIMKFVHEMGTTKMVIQCDMYDI